MGFNKEFNEVRAHGNTKFHPIHTNYLKKAANITQQYESHLNIQRHKIVRVDVEYTNENEDKEKAALVQLSIDKTKSVLLFQLSATKHKFSMFDNFLHEPRYTFFGFSIYRDIVKIERLGLDIADFVDIQKEWRVPN
ncbi:putative exonuclease mut-7-like protein [Hordeum vulgare]|nr:putative exonuclease mut-7-like protein [Hordeum vulgare]